MPLGHHRPIPNNLTAMTTITCAVAFLLALLTIPALILFRITESKEQTARRLRNQGQTWKRVGTRLGVSASTARRWAMA